MATVEVEFFKYPKVKYSTKQPPLDKGTKTQCFLKEETSVLNPVLQIRGASTTFGGSEFPDFNLAYIADFHRYYFVRNITSVSALIWEVTLEVDPLATYKNEILNANAFIEYGASGYNTSIPDGRLARTNSVATTFAEAPLPDVFSSIGCFVLTTINEKSDGKNGLATSYVGGQNVMQSISASLNASGWEEIKRYFERPMDALISCIWLPINMTSAGSGMTDVEFGPYNTGVAALQSVGVLKGNFSTFFKLPYEDGDFRNVEPYTELRITLPGVGMVQLPLCTIGGCAKSVGITVFYSIDLTVGKIVYRLETNGGATFMVCDGALGVPLPLSASTFNVGGYMTGVMSAIGGAATVTTAILTGGSSAAITAGATFAASGLVNGVSSASQNVASVSGSIGSRAGDDLNTGKMYIQIVTHEVSDLPSNVGAVVGRPVFKRGVISKYGSFVQCVGARVESSASAEEADAINEYLKVGVLIE